MGDRELLELAAKAADIKITWSKCAAHKDDYEYLGVSGPWVNGSGWNPLTDDGDAMRLESALSLNVRWQGQHVVVGRAYGDAWQEPFYLHGGDKLAARRYAAVRAAAAIAQQKGGV